jgi:hypothetical protein
MKIIIIMALIFFLIIAAFGLYRQTNYIQIKLLLYGNMRTSNCLYVDLSDDKDKIKIDNFDKNKLINSLTGLHGIKEIQINSSNVTILNDKNADEINMIQTANELNKIYGNRDTTYVSVTKNKNNKDNVATYTIIKKNKFTYFKKSENSAAEIPDTDFYIYGYGEPPVCI